MKKKITVLTSIILTLIIIVSTTYAYFGGRINKPNDNALAGVATKTLSLEFTDGPTIELNGVLPGQQIIKTFTVTNNGTESMYYSLKFDDVINELSRTSDLVYTLTSTNGGATISETVFPTADESFVLSNVITGNTSQVYTLTIEYKNLDEDQGDDMNKLVSATIILGEEEPETGLPAGLYDADDQLLISYSALVNDYGFNPEQDLSFVNTSNGNCTMNNVDVSDQGVPKCILTQFPDAKKLVLPRTVTRIGSYTLGTTGLTTIVVPNSVTSIGSNAFSSVKYVYYNGSATIPNNKWGAYNVNPYEEGDFLYADDTKHTIVGYVGEGGTIEIPNTVTTIGNYAFSGEKSITGVTYENGCQLERILFSSFSGSGITSITIPASVTTLGQAFISTTDLQTVIFENNSQITTLDGFSNSGIQSITIPASVTQIASNAFQNTSNLTSVTFAPNSQVASIGGYAFNKSGLTSITIPASVTSIGAFAFHASPNLTSVTFENTSNWTSSGTTVDVSNPAQNATNFLTFATANRVLTRN